MKPVFIVLQGPSVKWLADHIVDVARADAKWATVNYFWIYDFMPRSFDFVHFSADVHKEPQDILDKFDAFVWDGGWLFTNNNCDNYFSAGYPGRIVTTPFSHGLSPDGIPNSYNSVTAMIYILISQGYKKFYLFGCDGCGIPYGQTDDSDAHHFCIQHDTEVMNSFFWQVAKEFRLDLRDVQIFNVNSPENTKVTCFELMPYETFYAKLLHNAKA